MRPAFYNDPEYKRKQAEIVRQAWREGKFNSLIKPRPEKNCKNCSATFKVERGFEEKIFCNSSCSATFNNSRRKHSEATKRKISLSLKNSPYRYQPTPVGGFKPKVVLTCYNCKNNFEVLPYLAKRRKFCSNACAIKIVGAQTTSPKASKGKPGVRIDIDYDICFYSTWEANIARVFNSVGLKWYYAPRIFDLGAHTYRPDFYLPDFDEYIEVKNFMGEYSKERDRLFRQKYSDIKLYIISKNEYKEIEREYKFLIDFWE